MTFLPIIERELRVRARSRGTYWTRFAVALVGMLICLPQFAVPGSFASSASIGKGVFNWIAGTGFVLSCCACLLTADAVGSEQREGTLGLLFLTRVSRFDVLLGKLGSIGLTSLCVLVALLPMLMIPVLAGGVTALEALCKSLALLNALFFALAVGLFASTLRRERAQATGWALALVTLAVVVPLLAGSSSPPSAVVPWLSPLYAVMWKPGQSLGDWLASLAIVQAMAWLALLCAHVELNCSLREASAKDASPAPYRELDTLVRRRWQPLNAGADTIEWLVCRQRGVKAAIWTATGIGVCYQLVGTRLFRSAGGAGWVGYSAAMLPSLAVNVFDGALLAWAASRFFIEARQTGELELLLTTPLGAEAIVSGQWKALKRLVQWPIVMILAALVLRMFWNRALWSTRSGSSWTVYLACSLLVGAVYVLLGMGALCWTGLWFGLKARQQAGAILWTIGLTRGAPFLLYTLSACVFGVLASLSRMRNASWVQFYWLFAQVPSLLLFLWLIRRAKRRLAERLGGAEPANLGLWQPALAAIRKARHWTPS